MSDPDNEKRTNLRPAQVAASTMAALTGAFLAARIGVYGTVVGVGVMSLLSTIGGELYLRSMDRTKAAALARSRAVPVNWAASPRTGSWPPSVGGESEDTGSLPGDTGRLPENTARLPGNTGSLPEDATRLPGDAGHHRAAADDDAEATTQLSGESPDTAYLPGESGHPAEDTAQLPGGSGFAAEDTAELPDDAGHVGDEPWWSEPDDPADAAGPGEASGLSRLRRLRWPVIVASSVAAFVLAMIAITGIEAITGSRLSGGEGSTIGTVITPDRSGEEQPDEEPTDREPQEGPAPEPDPTAPGQDPEPAPEPTVPGPEDGTDDPPSEDEPPADEEDGPPADENPDDGQDP